MKTIYTCSAILAFCVTTFATSMQLDQYIYMTEMSEEKKFLLMVVPNIPKEKLKPSLIKIVNKAALKR